MKEIILAGGCFWGVEAYFQRLNGVVKTIVGYIDGITENPSYEEVCSGTTNHAEACKILYDEKIISLEKILEHLFVWQKEQRLVNQKRTIRHSARRCSVI